jgi:hypothetical protein
MILAMAITSDRLHKVLGLIPRELTCGDVVADVVQRNSEVKSAPGRRAGVLGAAECKQVFTETRARWL